MRARALTRTVLALAAAAMVSILSASADPITVPNSGFEDRATFDPFADGVDKYNQWAREAWRHWQRSFNGGPLRIWNPGAPGAPAQGAITEGFGGNAPEGDYVVLVRSRYSDGANTDGVSTFEAATQLLTNTFDNTVAYTLTAEVGNPVGGDSWQGYALQLAVGGINVAGASFAGRVDGGTVIAQDVNSLTVPVGEFVRSTVIYIPEEGHAALVGQPLQIRLAALEKPSNLALTSWVVFDDVTLATGTPPPPIPPTGFVLVVR